MANPEDDRWRHATVDVATEPHTPATHSAPTVEATPRAQGGADEEAVQPGPFDPPQRDRFQERGELGRGGMGRVFEAHDTSLDRLVAIKQSLTDDVVDLARFEREARITAQLQHPGIVPVIDAGRDDAGRPYYIMRKIEGRRLADMITDAKTATARIALVPRILGAVDAIAYAHSRGVIHRDLKSWNILLGDFGETLVIDWGLARELADKSPDRRGEAPVETGTDETASLTRAGHAYGTPGFMPPEQARGEVLGRPADVYALGAMLLHALQGTYPYAGVSARDAIAKTAADPRPDLSAIPDDVPPELTAIVAKAMEPKAADRYADAGALAEDLRRFTTGQLVAAHRYSLSELIGRWLRKYRIAVTVAVLAVVMLAVGGVIAIRGVVNARDRADEARLAEAARADELLVQRADGIASEDPTRAIALLKQLPKDSLSWEHASVVYETAASRGVARGRVAHRNVRTAWMGASPDGDVVASVAEDGKVLLHDPALEKPVITLATLDRPVQAAWFGRSLVVVGVEGALTRVDRDGTLTKLDGGGICNWVVTTPKRILATGRDGILREIDPRGGPVIKSYPVVREVTTIGEALIYSTSEAVIYDAPDLAPVTLTALARGATYELAVAVNQRHFALGLDTVVTKWEVTPAGVALVDRWETGARSLAFAGPMLVAEDHGRWSNLVGNHRVLGRDLPKGVIRGRTASADCAFVASWDGGLWMMCDTMTIRVGGKADVFVDLEVVSGRLLGITAAGLILSWELARLYPPTVRPAHDAILMPTVVAGGSVWSSGMGERVTAIEIATNITHDLGEGEVTCVSSKHVVVGSPISVPPFRFESIELTTRKRTLISDAFLGIVCSPTDDRVGLLDHDKIEVRDLSTDRRQIVAVDHDADRTALWDHWLLVATQKSGVIERIDLDTDARVRTTLGDIHAVAVDALGRVAVQRSTDVMMWSGAAPPTLFAPGGTGVMANPAGLVAFTRDGSLIVLDSNDQLRTYHGGSTFPPTVALRRPLASLPDPEGGIIVVDLATGSERHFPLPVTAAFIDLDGIQLLGSNAVRGFVWSLVPPPVATLPGLIEKLTNARLAPGSTRVEFDEP